jgi:hypothetical protein
MAATAVYASIARVPGAGGTDNDGVLFSNIAATTAAFQLRGGKYGAAVIASTYGTVTLTVLGPDGTTYLTALTAFAANGYATVDLPQGQYKIAIA